MEYQAPGSVVSSKCLTWRLSVPLFFAIRLVETDCSGWFGDFRGSAHFSEACLSRCGRTSSWPRRILDALYCTAKHLYDDASLEGWAPRYDPGVSPCLAVGEEPSVAHGLADGPPPSSGWWETHFGLVSVEEREHWILRQHIRLTPRRRLWFGSLWRLLDVAATSLRRKTLHWMEVALFVSRVPFGDWVVSGSQQGETAHQVCCKTGRRGEWNTIGTSWTTTV